MASPPYTDLGVSTLYQLRVINILQQELPTQLASTPYVNNSSGNYTTMLSQLATAYGDSSINDWGSTYPPVPANTNYYLSTAFESWTKSNNWPAVVVGLEQPMQGVVEPYALGPTQGQTIHMSILYISGFDGTYQQMVIPQRGAEAIFSVMATYLNDPLTLWQNGRISMITRDVPAFAQQASPTLVVGGIRFSAFIPQVFLNQSVSMLG